MLADPHQSHSPCPLYSPNLLYFSLPVYFSRNIMIFASLALLSGMVLSASAAPWYSPPALVPAPVIHWVNVSNNTAGLTYDPPYIVSPTKQSLYIDRCAHASIFQTAALGDIVSFKYHPKNHTVTQSSFDAPCTPLQGGTDTGLCVLLSKCFSHFVFSHAFSPDSVPVAPGTLDNDLPTRNFIVKDVRVPFDPPPLGGTNCPFPIRRNPSGSIVARLQTLRPATAVRAWSSR